MQDHEPKKPLPHKRKKPNQRKKQLKPRDNEHLADVLETYDDKNSDGHDDGNDDVDDDDDDDDDDDGNEDGDDDDKNNYCRVLIPGGAAPFNATDGYASAGGELYQLAKEKNDAGQFFPVWGTCLGFELLAVLSAGGEDIRNICEILNVAMPLVFKPAFHGNNILYYSTKASGALQPGAVALLLLRS
ncbi:hypothetical protein ANN_24930 [Periplaneta americana]|uniref:Folate gamma-glutamyl hydrolase n=1 Tax=Periplaneta americana TaxID=6978 RepID=A0ABQ8S0A3_PERAM|nr:hypothetical protein ANN_24930 [Periplaneta americana]